MADNNGYFGMSQEEIDSELRLLYNSYDMYERTIKETQRTMKSKTNPDGTKTYKKSDIDKRISLIEEAKNDILEKIHSLGGDVKDTNKKSKKSIINVPEQDLLVKKPSIIQQTNITESPRQANIQYNNAQYNSINSNESGFDLIPLPSNGQCYYNKIDKVLVSPLCANDENMIIAPNLYRDDLILDYLLRAKVKNCEIDTMDMLDGDREAILLWLRSEGYGNEFPVRAKDNDTNEEFDAVVDLSKIKYKPFNLIGDKYGLFEYTMPKCGSVIKFKFLTHRDKLELNKEIEYENDNIKKSRLNEFINTMDSYLDRDKDLKQQDVAKTRRAIRDIESWCEAIHGEPVAYNHGFSRKLEMSIISVDGITDREYISNFVYNLNVRDSSSLRKYISDNEPGIDYHFIVDKPESLGGGSQEVFLQFDKFLFLNVSDV